MFFIMCPMPADKFSIRWMSGDFAPQFPHFAKMQCKLELCVVWHYHALIHAEAFNRLLYITDMLVMAAIIHEETCNRLVQTMEKLVQQIALSYGEFAIDAHITINGWANGNCPDNMRCWANRGLTI